MSKAGDELKDCGRCKAMEEQYGKGPHFKPAIPEEDQCFVCKKPMTRMLDTHHTSAKLCSLDCEQQYWLDILY